MLLIDGMETNDENELSFELLASANSRVLQRILGEPRERLCEDDTAMKFLKLQGMNTNERPLQMKNDRRRGS